MTNRLSPGTHTLVPEALSVLIEDHDLTLVANPAVPAPELPLPGNACRSYLTRGLEKFGQREVMFVLAPAEADSGIRFEQDVLQLLHLICSMARDGRKVDEGGRSFFGAGALFDSPGCGIAYVRSIEGLGPPVPKEALLALFLRKEECAAVEVAGVYRVTAWLGRAYRQFPYPKFSDPSRPAVVPPGLPESFLSKVPVLWANNHGSAFLQNKTLTVRLNPDGLSDGLKHVFKAMEINPAFGIVTGHVSHADARLVCLPKGSAPELIGPAGSTHAIIEGGFVIFAGRQEIEQAWIVEDGFSAMLGSDSWATLRRAMESRTDISVPMAGDENRFVRELRIEFVSSSGRRRSIQEGGAR